MIKTVLFYLIIIQYLILTSCGSRNGMYDVKRDNSKASDIINTEESEEEKGRIVFRRNCASCHSTSNKPIVGPGLGGILNRLPSPSETYLHAYLTKYDSLILNEEYAKRIKLENKDISYSHQVLKLTEQDFKYLVSYLKVADKPMPIIQE